MSSHSYRTVVFFLVFFLFLYYFFGPQKKMTVIWATVPQLSWYTVFLQFQFANSILIDCNVHSCGTIVYNGTFYFFQFANSVLMICSVYSCRTIFYKGLFIFSYLLIQFWWYEPHGLTMRIIVKCLINETFKIIRF